MLCYLLVRASIALWGLDWPVDRELAAVFCGVSVCETIAELPFVVMGVIAILTKRRG